MLALAAWARRAAGTAALVLAIDLLRGERAWLRPGRSWHGAPVEGAAFDGAMSLSAGAAGIGIARLGVYAAARPVHLLAEASAAIELVRIAAAAPGATDDASLGRGLAGTIELLLVAAATLAEPAHLGAARRLGTRLIEQARAGRRAGASRGARVRHPSLWGGIAGTGLVLLRLHDPALAPSAALPACLP